MGIDLWSQDDRTIYFSAGIRTTRQLMALDVDGDTVRQLTDQDGAVNVSRDMHSGVVLISYSNPDTPSTLFTVPSLDR